MTYFPGWLQAIAPISPGYWGLALLRAAVRGDAAAAVRPALVLVVLAATAALFAAWRLTRDRGRATLV